MRKMFAIVAHRDGKRFLVRDDEKLTKAGWSLGCVSAVDSEGRTIWIVDAHRDDGKLCILRADEKLRVRNWTQVLPPQDLSTISQKMARAHGGGF